MPKFTFVVSSEGRLPQGIASTLTAQLKTLAGIKCTIELCEAKTKRSLDQNAFLWSVVYTTIREFHLEQGAAYSIEQIHEACLHDYAPKVELTMIDGTIKIAPMRSKDMSVTEMNQYIMNIEAALADFGISFPAPPWQQPN
jgi:hypothetical protein